MSLPENWKDLGWQECSEFVDSTGWPIIWIPPREVVADLLAAPEADRAAVPDAAQQQVLDDADRVLSQVPERVAVTGVSLAVAGATIG